MVAEVTRTSGIVTQARLRKAAVESVSLDEARGLFRKLYDHARRGEPEHMTKEQIKSIELLFSYLFGKPTQPIQIEEGSQITVLVDGRVWNKI